jgi:hypothetical protein
MENIKTCIKPEAYKHISYAKGEETKSFIWSFILSVNSNNYIYVLKSEPLPYQVLEKS